MAKKKKRDLLRKVLDAPSAPPAQNLVQQAQASFDALTPKEQETLRARFPADAPPTKLRGNDVKVTLYLDAEVYKALKHRAVDLGCSVSAIIRELLGGTVVHTHGG